MNPINALPIGGSGEGGPPPPRNNRSIARSFSRGMISMIVMLIMVFVGMLFHFVILNPPSMEGGRLYINRSATSVPITYFFSVLNIVLSICISCFMNSNSRLEVFLFVVLMMTIFVMFLLVKLHDFSTRIQQPATVASVTCYFISEVIVLALFFFRFFSSEESPRPVVEEDINSQHGDDTPPGTETPPPPYTYFPMYDQIPMVDLSPDPPPYQEPPPVYTSRENVGEDETQFGENGSEEDPYEDMPPLED
ncbi:hypothetical protein [Candidatus Similichlamydia epinepheli]|uniref:hypothetical protein n=1 Tax=Candidatus Similichlamydia epinepheli TaxID=1903953 RepID=UPI000D350FDD|nr:hypothetical protein [Candidatus Similichlamydia epinepheli]